MTSERSNYATIPLEDAPEVDTVLERLGLGRFRPDTLTSFPGRNDTWAGTTDTGKGVFVKRLNGPTEDARRRISRVAVVENLITENPDLRAPRCHTVDTETRLIVSELIDDVRSGADLSSEDLFTEEMSEEAGRMIATLHSITPPESLIEEGPQGVANRNTFQSISLLAYAAATAGELEMWTLLHADQKTAAALSGPVGDPKDVRPVLIHGDLRLDQFLSDGEVLYLTDWEDCQVDDPARDIGAFAGEWLYRSVLSMNSTPDDPVAGAARRFELLRTNIERFWSAYLDTRPEAKEDEQLATRATTYAGRHMFDRALASSQRDASLSPLDKAVGGVGRLALRSPADFTTTMGFGKQS